MRWIHGEGNDEAARARREAREARTRIAVLDDPSNQTWSALEPRAEVLVIDPATANGDAAALLAGFDVAVILRAGPALTDAVIARLPDLKLLLPAPGAGQVLDLDACTEAGILVWQPGGQARPVYGEIVENVLAFLHGAPIRTLNPEAAGAQ